MDNHEAVQKLEQLIPAQNAYPPLEVHGLPASMVTSKAGRLRGVAPSVRQANLLSVDPDRRLVKLALRLGPTELHRLHPAQLDALPGHGLSLAPENLDNILYLRSQGLFRFSEPVTKAKMQSRYGDPLRYRGRAVTALGLWEVEAEVYLEPEADFPTAYFTVRAFEQSRPVMG